MLGRIGPLEITLILLIIVLLFGARKLPELARGTGRALRIFKAETKGLIDDDEDDDERPTSDAAGELNAPDSSTDPLSAEKRRDTSG